MTPWSVLSSIPKSEIDSSSADGDEKALGRALIPYPGPHGGPATGTPSDVDGAIPVEVHPPVNPTVHKMNPQELAVSLTMIGRHVEGGRPASLRYAGTWWTKENTKKEEAKESDEVSLGSDGARAPGDQSISPNAENLPVRTFDPSFLSSSIYLRSYSITAGASERSGERHWPERAWRYRTGRGCWPLPDGWTPRPRPRRGCAKWPTEDSRAG